MDFEVDFKVDLEFKFSSHPMKGNLRRSWILDSTLWIPDSCTGFLIFLKNWNLDFGFQLLVGFRIPKTRIPYSTSEFVPDSGFFKQNFPSLHSRNRHHASEVKALCITAHCCTLQFRYRCYLCGCGRLRVYET